MAGPRSTQTRQAGFRRRGAREAASDSNRITVCTQVAADKQPCTHHHTLKGQGVIQSWGPWSHPQPARVSAGRFQALRRPQSHLLPACIPARRTRARTRTQWPLCKLRLQSHGLPRPRRSGRLWRVGGGDRAVEQASGPPLTHSQWTRGVPLTRLQRRP